MMERVKLDQNKVKGRFIYHFFKRTLDIVASACALIILSPLFLVLAILKMVVQLSIRKSESVRMVNHLKCISFVR